MDKSVADQVELLSAGAAEVLPENGLAVKLSEAGSAGRPLIVKLGVDPTAPDLHLGHSVPLRKLRQFQDLGHRAVLIIGDFTATIGDPSGRTVTRPQLTTEEIAANARTYTDQAFKILDADPDKLWIRYNSEWLAKLTLKDVLELTARFTVAALLVRDDFTKRYEAGEPIGLHEFMYPVMQAYDSVVIQADVELGGTDQKFNLLAGRELQEKFRQSPQIALTLPLLEGTDGVRKMSKSYDNHIGLTFAPADMFGKVMSIPDEGPGQPRFSLIVKYYQLALGYPPERIAKLAADLSGGDLDPRDAKEELAWQIAATYHGKEAADAAKADFEARFRTKSAQAALALAEDREVRDIRGAGGAVWVPRLLVASGTASSTSEGRRLVAQGGVRLRGELVTDPGAEVEVSDGDLLEVGKRTKLRLRFRDGESSDG